jgi:hypothetical protein
MKDGSKQECIVIPIKKNNLFRTDKGNVFLDIYGNEIPPEKRKVITVKSKDGTKEYDRYESTHIANQSLPEDVREKLKSEGKYAQTLGNLTDSNLQLNSGGSESANVSDDFAPSEPGDDLPF